MVWRCSGVMETKLGELVREESWARLPPWSGDSGHHTPTGPWASCCSFLSWFKTLPAQTPRWPAFPPFPPGVLLVAVEPHTHQEQHQLPILTRGSCSPQEGSQSPHTDHYVSVPLPHFHLSPKPACSPPSLLLAVPVFSPFLQTQINPGCHFPGCASGMNCALLFWQVSFPSPAFPHTLQSLSHDNSQPAAPSLPVLLLPALIVVSPLCQAASPEWTCLQLDLMILIIFSNLNDPVVHKNQIGYPECNNSRIL